MHEEHTHSYRLKPIKQLHACTHVDMDKLDSNQEGGWLCMQQPKPNEASQNRLVGTVR